MLRPSENDIWQVLDGKDSRAAEKVAVWLSSEEGMNWISDNSDEIFRKLTESESEVDVPTEEMLENIHRQIRMLIRKRKLRRIVSVAAAVLLPVLFISVFWININSRVGNILFASSETVSESAVLGERKVVVFQDGTKVYLNAGTHYGASGEGFIRMNLACPQPVLDEALNRLFAFLKKAVQ